MINRFTIYLRVILTLSLFVILSVTTLAQKSNVKGTLDYTSMARITGTAEGATVAYTNPYTSQPASHFAGAFNGTLNSQAEKFYCIDLQHYLVYNEDYWDESSTPSEITYILNNYFPYKTSYPNKLTDLNKEAAAIQFAIWHFSDGNDANTITNDATIKSRALAIIADASTNHNNVVILQSLIFVPAAQSLTEGTAASFDVYAYDLDGNPVSNLSITLTTTLGTLSATSATTDLSGRVGPITLTYSGIGTATIGAKAKVEIPQGTRYVHKALPGEKQKLVLATPSFDNKEVYATVTWYTASDPGTCDTKGFTTFTQGGWGGPSNSTPGKIRDLYFSTVFPTGLTVGGTFKLTLTSAEAVKNYLPDGGTAAAYTQNYTDPTSAINVLSGQLTALKLNVYYDAAGKIGSNSTNLGDLVIAKDDFTGMLVSDFLAFAESAIGGGPLNGYTFSQINDAATAINENFDNGTVDKHFLSCVDLVCKNTLGDFVWHDKNYNGIQDANEPGIKDVAVELIFNGNVIATSTTDITGKYSFTNLSNGTYSVRVAASNYSNGGVLFSTAQTKWYASPKNQGSDDSKDSDADKNESVSVTLNCNNNATVDFGFFKTCVSVVKTADKATANPGDVITYTFTVENCGDVTLSGGVDLYDALINPVGDHKIGNLTPVNPGTTKSLTKTYTVKDTDCGQLVNTVKAIGHPINGSANVEFEASVTTEIICKASIGDKVWLDINKNGIQDNGEVGKEGVTVELYTCADVLVGTTTTDASGIYQFTNLTPGDYYVVFVLPSGYTFSPADQGGNDATDSDANSTTGKAICTTLTPGETDNTWDAGVYVYEECKNIVGSYVYHDANINGTKDLGEAGIAGAIVELVQGSTVLATSTTDINGQYSFSNLVNGTYTVRLAGSNFTTGGVLFNTDQTKWYTKNSTSINTTLNCNDNLSINFGYFKTCVSITKSSDKQSYNKGETITYSFIVENCGDIQLHGGVDIFDAMLNPSGNHLIKHINLLTPGQSTTFTYTYVTSDGDCGQLTNTVRAEGHPVEGSTQNCDTQGFITYTPGGWGAPANGNNAGTLRDQYFSTVFPGGLIVGGNYTLTLSDAAAVEAFLPSGGQSVALTQDYINPGGSLSNTLAGHIVSNTLAVKFNEAGYLGTNATLLGDLVISTGTFAGMTVNQFLNLANIALGGGATIYSYSDFTSAATAINENFDNGTNDNGFLICSGSSITYDTVIDESSWTVTIICDEKADIKIEKIVDNPNPQCDDLVTFTIKATNFGPNAANDIQVTDLLPSGLDYVSNTTSQGSYNSTTGIWTVGTLANNAFATLTITVKVDCGQVNNSVFDLGVAKDFNLFVIEDANQPSSDTQGKVAVGHDATFANYSIGDQLPANSGDVLIVGNDLNYISGAIYNGNVVYGHATNLPQSGVSITGGILRHDSPINFASAKSYLENLSTTLSTSAVNGTTAFQYGGLTLTGTDPFLNVFAVNGSNLSSANNVSITAPNGSVVLVNISGTTLTWTGGLVVNGTATTNVLFNFYQATSLTIQGIDITGSVLAPFANLNFASGVINGQMICKSLTGMGQFNNVVFGGQIPVNENITNIAFISGSSLLDPNPGNNSSSATITINGTSNGGNNGGNTGGNTGGNGGGTWTNVCSFGPGEIVYTLAYSNSAIFAGTWGGKIYQSTNGGTSWTVINEGMNVSFIWSLNISGGVIFAATEQGVYKYNGSTWVLTSLAGKDVHSIVSYNGTIYAATWGFGIYKSVNGGTSWTQINNGLGAFLAVQTLTVASNGDVFAGTAGGGIYKCTDGLNWTKITCGYQSIWSMSSTSSAIFAGTYGDGLYRSLDGGMSFTKTSLDITFVYSIAVDLTGKIFVSSLTNGVYVSSDNGSTWSSLGMGGFGVSAMMVNPNSSDVYVGTKEGQVFMISSNSSVTDVDDNSVLPKEYKLAQNYPNPFNPSTTIQFVVPEAGMYSLKVYNVLGEEVANLIDNQLASGLHKVTFDATKLTSGMYIYRLSGNKVNISKKMILMK